MKKPLVLNPKYNRIHMKNPAETHRFLDQVPSPGRQRVMPVHEDVTELDLSHNHIKDSGIQAT